MAENAALAAPAIVDRRATIVVLAHRLFGCDANTTLSFIARGNWEPRGHRVLVHRGLKPPPAADLAILHVPLTRIPQAYADLSANYRHTLNGAVIDVSKRRIATDLVGPDDSYDGAVIVKTDFNHAGMAERRMRRAACGWRARLLFAMERHSPAHWFGRLPDNRYLVFAHKSEVPRWVWHSRGLVVQPFHAERRGDLYALHQWYFLGSHECVSSFLSHDPVAKLSSVEVRLPLHGDVPDAIRRRRAELNFDYGKFDYVIADGMPILLDANNTPNEGSGQENNPRVLAICAAMAGGLADFLR